MSRLAANSPPSDPPTTMTFLSVAMTVSLSARSVADGFGDCTLQIEAFGLGRRKVQFDGHARRVFDEHLVQTQARHPALAERQAGTSQPPLDVVQVRCKKGQMVDRRAAVQGRLRLVAEVLGQAGRVVLIAADQMNDAVVR